MTNRFGALVLCLGGCVDAPLVGTVVKQSCEQAVCAYAPDCSPLTTGGWDWRSEAACLGSFECGAEPEACERAVFALPCLSAPPTWPEIEANTRALLPVRAHCGGR